VELVSTREVFAWGLDPILGVTMVLIFSNCAMMNVEKFPKICHYCTVRTRNPTNRRHRTQTVTTRLIIQKNCQCPACVSPASKDSLVVVYHPRYTARTCHSCRLFYGPLLRFRNARTPEESACIALCYHLTVSSVPYDRKHYGFSRFYFQILPTHHPPAKYRESQFTLSFSFPFPISLVTRQVPSHSFHFQPKLEYISYDPRRASYGMYSKLRYWHVV